MNTSQDSILNTPVQLLEQTRSWEMWAFMGLWVLFTPKQIDCILWDRILEQSSRRRTGIIEPVQKCIPVTNELASTQSSWYNIPHFSTVSTRQKEMVSLCTLSTDLSETSKPHRMSLSRTGNLLRKATQKLKACFGMQPLNQTILDQGAWGARGLRWSHVREILLILQTHDEEVKLSWQLC